MRYYRVDITDATSGTVVRTFTSLTSSGAPNMSALQVEFDVSVVGFATPVSQAYFRLWGISLRDIGQSSDFNGKGIRVYAGMAKGLPLANPAQAGLIVQGTILQALGNWLGTSQTLDFIIGSGTGAVDAPINIVLDWKANVSLATAIQTTLQTALPGYTVNINISPKLVLAHDEAGYYQTLEQFASWIKQVSQDIVGGAGYAGVDIVLHEKTITVYDGTSSQNPRNILSTELIGQPTWIEPGKIQFKCPIRADLQVSDFVKLPPGLATTTSGSLSQYRDSSVFQGVFAIQQIRHVGNLRQPDASSWVTTFDAYLTAAASPSS